VFLQDKDQSRNVVASLFELFTTIRTVDGAMPGEFSPGQAAVRRVHFTEDTLRISLGFPIDHLKTGKTLTLLDRLQLREDDHGGGDGFVKHLRGTSEALAVSLDGQRQTSGISVFREPANANETVLEFKAWM
jgi:hypothetical protein